MCILVSESVDLICAINELSQRSPWALKTNYTQFSNPFKYRSLRSHSDAKPAEEAEMMTDWAASVEMAVGSGDVSLTPVASAKTPPERSSEGVCSNKMSVVVGVKGLEPSTSRSQTARASQLRHTPRS